MEQQQQQKQQRNIEKELGIYQVEYMRLMAINVSLQAEIEDLKEQLNKKDETVSQ